MKFLALIAMIVLASAAMAKLSPAPKAAVDQLIPWLLDEDQQLRGVPFSEVIFDTTGKKVFRFDANNTRPFRTKKILDRPRICEIDFGATSRQQIGEAFGA